MPVFLDTPQGRSRAGWTLLRFVLACLIAAHGWVRWLDHGVVGFGEWLDGQGIPFGFAIAAFITGFEIVGTLLLACELFVLPVTLVYASIYAMGIVLVHAPAGWFVVGHGRNGMEYSVLLIACLLCVGLQHCRSRGDPTKRPTRTPPPGA